MSSIKKLALIPILLSLFVMGFADFAAIASNYAKVGLEDDNTMAALLPTIAYLMCPFLAYPAYRLTFHLGRKRTIMLSLFIVAAGTLMPLVHAGVGTVTVSLVTLGVGNTTLWVSLIPLLASIVKTENLLPVFSLGQCFRMLPTCVAPLTIVASASAIGPHRTFEWSLLCIVYAILALFALVLFAMTPLDDEEEQYSDHHQPYINVSLLKSPMVLFTLFIVFCNTGIDLGMGAIVPQVLSERLDESVFDAIHSSGIYYLMRSFGCLIGVLLLSNESNRRNFLAFVCLIVLSLAVLLFTESEFMMLCCVALTGIGCANISSIAFCKILNLYPAQRDEASAYVVTFFCGGVFIPMFMAQASARLGVEAGIVTMLVASLAMLVFYFYVFGKRGREDS